MKLKIHKKSKRIIILIFALLLVFSCLQLFPLLEPPQKIKTESTVYEGACEPKAAYLVLINPNEVFPGTSQDEGMFYSKRILNQIRTDFEVNYQGSETVPLDIEYQVLAKVNGFQGEDPNKVIYWSKSFPVTGKITVKEEKSSSWNKKERVDFQLNNYDSFAVRAKEITGMNVSSELLVSMEGMIVAHTEKEDLETPFNVNIRIPLMEDVFQIRKTGTDPVKNSVTETVETQAPFDLFRAVLYGALSALCLVGLIIMVFFTRMPNREEELLKKANVTVKDYGSRIVALHSFPKVNYRQYYKVNSIKDLIKVADELQKPIFYEIDKDTLVKDYEFHVVDKETVYSLLLDSPEE